MKDFLTFRTMITPVLVQCLFWVAIVSFVAIAVIDIIHHESYRVVFLVLVVGPLATRIVCEMLILLFRIHDRLVAIESNTRR